MTTKRWGLTALALLLVCAPLSAARAAEPGEEERRVRNGPAVSVFGPDIHIPAHEIRRDPVVCIGCAARIEGEVRDNVVVVFGELEMDGAKVGQNVVGVFSRMRVLDSDVDEVLVNVLGEFEGDGASGNVVNVSLPFGWAPPMQTILFWCRAVGLLLVFIVLIGTVSVAPERVEVLAREAPVRYFSAFFVGLLGYLAYLILLTLLLATVIGLPAGILFFMVFKWVGIAGIFLCLGRRIGRSFGREMSPLGGVLLVFGLYAGFILVLGWLGVAGFIMLMLFRLFFWLMFEVPAVGLMILTRLGTNGGTLAYAPAGPAPAAPPDPGPPPAPDPET